MASYKGLTIRKVIYEPGSTRTPGDHGVQDHNIYGVINGNLCTNCDCTTPWTPTVDRCHIRWRKVITILIKLVIILF